VDIRALRAIPALTQYRRSSSTLARSSPSQPRRRPAVPRQPRPAAVAQGPHRRPPPRRRGWGITKLGTCHLFRHTAATFADDSSTPTSASSNSCSPAPSSRPPSSLPDNSAGSFDYGGLDQHQRGTEHEAGIVTVEMKARQYVPGPGGSSNSTPSGGGQRLRVRGGRSGHQLRSRRAVLDEEQRTGTQSSLTEGGGTGDSCAMSLSMSANFDCYGASFCRRYIRGSL
jgi:hypothetical protein